MVEVIDIIISAFVTLAVIALVVIANPNIAINNEDYVIIETCRDLKEKLYDFNINETILINYYRYMTLCCNNNFGLIECDDSKVLNKRTKNKCEKNPNDSEFCICDEWNYNKRINYSVLNESCLPVAFNNSNNKIKVMLNDKVITDEGNRDINLTIKTSGERSYQSYACLTYGGEYSLIEIEGNKIEPYKDESLFYYEKTDCKKAHLKPVTLDIDLNTEICINHTTEKSISYNWFSVKQFDDCAYLGKQCSEAPAFKESYCDVFSEWCCIKKEKKR